MKNKLKPRDPRERFRIAWRLVRLWGDHAPEIMGPTLAAAEHCWLARAVYGRPAANLRGPHRDVLVAIRWARLRNRRKRHTPGRLP